MNFSCRFYSKESPNIDDVVMARVHALTDLGVYVHLLEYNNVEAMLQISELSRRRIRSVNKLIRVGRLECLSVLRVDDKKGYIDLSKRRVTFEDALICRKRYARAKAINSVLHRAAEILEYDSSDQFQDLYRKTAWHFDEKCNQKTASFDVFNTVVTSPSILDECEIDNHTKQVLLDCVTQKLLALPRKLSTTFELCHFGYEGIDAVKDALNIGLACSTDEVPLKITLISHPDFAMTTIANESSGLAVMNKALQEMKESIESVGGYYKLSSAPNVVTENNEPKVNEIPQNHEEDNENIDQFICGDSFD